MYVHAKVCDFSVGSENSDIIVFNYTSDLSLKVLDVVYQVLFIVLMLLYVSRCLLASVFLVLPDSDMYHITLTLFQCSFYVFMCNHYFVLA